MTPAKFLMLSQSPEQQVKKIFRASPTGLWLDASDADTAWQESTAVTVGALDSPVGKRLSRGGNIAAVLQATSVARPSWKLDAGIYSDLLDGIDDGYASDAFSAGSLSSDMECFIAMKRNSAAKFIPAFLSGGGAYFGVTESGGVDVTSAGAGSPTYLVNGVAVPGGTATTRAQLDTALPVGQWLVLETRGLDLSAWTSFCLGNYGGWPLSGNVGGVILCRAQTDMARVQIRRYLGRKVGRIYTV